MIRMAREENVELAKRSVIDSIWKEANLEGIGATYPQTKEIYEGRAVSGLTIDETVAINNLKHAWQFIMDNLDVPTDLSFVRQVHYLVGNGLVSTAGDLRMGDVGIGGTSWKPEIPDFDDAKERICEIANDDARDLDSALRMFAYLCRSQLFFDGNKRTAQIVTNKIMIERGLGILAVPVEQKPTFEEQLIRFYENGDPTSLMDFLKKTSVVCYEACAQETPQDPNLEALKAAHANVSLKDEAHDSQNASAELFSHHRPKVHHATER